MNLVLAIFTINRVDQITLSKRALTKRPLYLLLAAALLHVFGQATQFSPGEKLKYRFVPAQFRQRTRRIASDCFPMPGREVADPVEVLKNSGQVTWATWPQCTFGLSHSLPPATNHIIPQDRALPCFYAIGLLSATNTYLAIPGASSLN